MEKPMHATMAPGEERNASARVDTRRGGVRTPWAMPMGVFVLVMVITLLSVTAIKRVEDEKLREQMRAVSSSIASALERRANANIAYMRAGAILMSAGKPMNEAQFRAFASTVERDEEYQGSEGMSWARRLDRDEIPAYEARRRRTPGNAGYTIYPIMPPGRREAVVVDYLGTVQPYRRPAQGFDMYSEPLRRAALDQAAREGRPVATGRVALLRWAGRTNWAGFLIYVPVFTTTGHVLLGYLSTPFNASQFLTSAMELEKAPGLGVRLYDGLPAQGQLLAMINSADHPAYAVRRDLTVAQRHMTLVIDSSGAPFLPTVGWVLLGSGTVVALLLAAIASMVVRQAAEDRASLGWLREQASIRNSLTRELNHRVKNTLASVLSIIALTRRRATGLEDFTQSLVGRIRALSATHDLLTESNWGPTALGKIITAELAPYTLPGDTVVDLAGPPVDLAPNDALSLGLAVHELATNAGKYGALSVLGGRVSVRWEMAGERLVRVQWQEYGGPLVVSERRRGFGTELIERIVAHELGQKVELDFAEQGVRCVLLVPVRTPSPFRIRALGQ